MTTIGHNIVSFRSGIADEINKLSIRWARNTISLGGKLKQAQATFHIEGNPSRAHRPGWAEWLKEETGWTTKHASNFIRIHDRFEALANALDAPLSYGVMLYLSGEEVPEAGVSEVVTLANSGKKIGLGQAKEIVKKSRPSPKNARVQARETGKLVLASDGNLYSGATEDEQAAYSERRTLAFAIRDAIATIAGCELTPTQWLARAEAHWIKDMTPAEIKRAIAWLTKLEGKYGHD